MGQSELLPHSTQPIVTGSQTGAACGHCDDAVHPTHAPELASQMGSAFGQSESAMHGLWHWAAPGQHEEADIGQSLLWAQAPQRPVAVMQMGAGCAQFVSSRHSTQPSWGLHCWSPGHCALPLTPQSALPEVRLLPLLPLHAIAATMKAASMPAKIPLPPTPLTPRLRRSMG